MTPVLGDFLRPARAHTEAAMLLRAAAIDDAARDLLANASESSRHRVSLSHSQPPHTSSRRRAGPQQRPPGTSHVHRPAAVNTSGSRRLLPRLPAVYLEESREPRARKARRSKGTLTHCRQASGHYGTVAAQTEGRRFGPTCRRLRSPRSRGRPLPPPHGRVCRSERTVAVAVSL